MRPSPPAAEQRARTVAALYVMPRGPYYGLPDVEPWGLPDRDARLYAGPWPVVAHPPCARWSKLAYIVRAKLGKAIGDDDGCFAAALAAVRRWGGVLEHPEGSAAWPAFHLLKPRRNGWSLPDAFGGRVCRVDQGNYGHRARKATYLYAVCTEYPHLIWQEAKGKMRCEWMNGLGSERAATPEAFRDLLLSIARSARPGEPVPQEETGEP